MIHIPFLETSLQSIFSITQNDGAKNFIIRKSYCMARSIVKVGNDSSSVFTDTKTSIDDSLYSVLRDFLVCANVGNKSIVSVAHNFIIDSADKKEDYKIAMQNPITMNLLSLMHSYLPNEITIELSDILSHSGHKMLGFPSQARFDLLQTLIGKLEFIRFTDAKHNLNISIPKYEQVGANELPYKIEEILDTEDSTYYRIEIFGKRNYVVYNQFIPESFKFCSTKIEREYTQQMNALSEMV